MKIGIFGLPATGKKTIFRILTGSEPSEVSHKQEPVEGFTLIDDTRLYALQKIYNPKRTVKARIYLELLPDFERESISSGRVFSLLNDCDALCHIVRQFPDDRVYHEAGSVDPLRDIKNINSELILHDLSFVEKRIEKIEKERTAPPETIRELAVMQKMKFTLEEESSLRTASLESAELKMISGYRLLSLKPLITVLNTGEEVFSGEEDIDSFLEADRISKVKFCAKIESEIEELPPGAEREDMLAAMGIAVPAAETLKRAFIDSLGLMTFFTASEEELRQWLTDAGSSADMAAGKIHTDMQRGFIKAEVIRYGDLIEAGSEEKAASMGKKMLKGKDYPVTDGDILSIRFNV